MGTPAVSVAPRKAGAHAQARADQLRLLLATRRVEPVADRWARGARGERRVGAILEGLGPDWHVLHDVSLGRGNIDHVLIGPGGTFTIETKRSSRSSSSAMPGSSDRYLLSAAG
jgi:hypothetical protein